MKIKKITVLVIALFIITNFFTICSYANENSNLEYIKMNQGTEADIIENQKNQKFIEEVQWANTPMPMVTYVPIKLSVTAYEQEKSYWCGPANIKQVIQYINGSSSSQSTYASSMGTNSTDGTYVYKMVNELNKRQSDFKYAYKYVSSSMSVDDFLEIVEKSIYAKKPMILHADTKSLSYYNGASLGHYLTLNGFAYDVAGPMPSGKPQVYCVDSYYKDYGKGSVFGEHQISASSALNSVKDRYIIY